MKICRLAVLQYTVYLSGRLLQLLQSADMQELTNDPAMELALSATDMGYELSGKMMPAYEKILRGEREFMAA